MQTAISRTGRCKIKPKLDTTMSYFVAGAKHIETVAHWAGGYVEPSMQ